MSLDDFRNYVEDVRQANPIAEVVGDNATLTHTGRVLMCSSPLRRDRTPSFAVYDDGRWYDYGTSEGGDVFKYVMLRDGVEFREAVDVLATRAGVELWSTRGVDVETVAAREILAGMLERRWVAELINEAADYYHRVLPTRVREMVRDTYGFTDEQIDAFKVGWSSGALLPYLHIELGHSVDRLIKTGLFVRTARGPVDFFEHRIMFPYFEHGLARYMIGRRVEGHTSDVQYERGKYKKQLTHSERNNYVSKHVTHILFGLDSMRGRREVLVIAEGITDAMSAIAHGFACISPVTVTFRDADIERMIEHAKRFTRVVIFNDIGDASNAGTKGALKTAAALFRADIDVRIVDLGSLVRGATT